MHFLEVSKETMINLLIQDNKLSVVREAVLNDDYEGMIKRERLKYCSLDMLNNLVVSEDNLLDIAEIYTLSLPLIEIVIDEHLDYINFLSFVIENYTNILEPKHFEKLWDNKKLRKKIQKNSDKANEKSIIYLYETKKIDKLTQHQEEIYLKYEVSRKDIKAMNLNEIAVALIDTKFSLEDIEYIVNLSLETKSDLHIKGIMSLLLQTQSLPDYMLMDILENWDCKEESEIFRHILAYQNLDNVIDYILENRTLSRKSMIILIQNKKTSIKKLKKLYEIDIEVIVHSMDTNLPILDCHIHMV